MSRPLGSVGRSDWRWIQLSRRLRAEMAPVCHRCGQDIDRSLHHRDRMSWTLDHVQPLSAGGDPYDVNNLRPAHRSCNSRDGAVLRNTRKQQRGDSGNVSRRW